MERKYILALASACILCTTSTINAALIIFDDLIIGSTSYAFDGDGDNVDDVIFSTTDPSGFNTVGPGPNMSYIEEPGLEWATLINPDLRVDFLVGAAMTLRFGFALDDVETVNTWATFEVYNINDNLLG